jgi:alkanesulfonate monooxygenase SsuD/methylene tetrahydromethanopterin reductase-like flavin-dependent oxidoreductase (luciferase family)
MPDAEAPPDVLTLYRQTLTDHGHDAAGMLVAINPSIYVCDDPERGWHEVKEHFLYAYNRYRIWLAKAGERTTPPLEDADKLPHDRYLVGTPEQVALSILALHDRTGFDRLYFWARPPGLAVERSSHSLELFAKEVIPRLRGHFVASRVPGLR